LHRFDQESAQRVGAAQLVHARGQSEQAGGRVTEVTAGGTQRLVVLGAGHETRTLVWRGAAAAAQVMFGTHGVPRCVPD
jgi:hypothetical protein